jgi:hypothetical protein
MYLKILAETYIQIAVNRMIQPRRWKQYVSRKRYLPTCAHGVRVQSQICDKLQSLTKLLRFAGHIFFHAKLKP